MKSSDPVLLCNQWCDGESEGGWSDVDDNIGEENQLIVMANQLNCQH